MSAYDTFLSATEPHDQYGLIAVVIMLAAALYFKSAALVLIAVSIVIVVGVLVDLTAHGWSH